MEPEELVAVPVAGSLDLVDSSELRTLTTTTGPGGEVAAAGDIDLSSDPTFRAFLIDVIDLPCSRTLIVDLRRVMFLSARAVDSLGRAHRHARDRGARLAVVAGSRHVLRALRATEASRIEVFGTVAAARAAEW